MSFQILKKKEPYDVIIVGSGAGGGMTAKILADAGLKIALLEAGPHFDPKNEEQQTQMKWPYESPRRGASTKNRPFGDFDMSYGGWEIDGEPYSRKNNTDFDWFRSRMLGGRTNHWGRISLRFGPLDFKRKNLDGLGDNWPISYDDVAPYYDKVDKLVGIFGTKENIPNEPDGYFLPPPKPRLHELYIRKKVGGGGIPVIPSRLSILTRPINKDRGVCFYCRQCNRSCKAYADFSSGSVLVFPAIQTGNVDLYVNAMVRSVLTDAEGKANAVSYIDKTDKKEYQLRGKVIVLAASACSSARILLNSKDSQNSDGLANSSGVVGRYLHDSTGTDRAFLIPELLDRERYNEDGVGGLHVYTPWWLNGKKLDFPRGYHLEYWGGMGMPGYGIGMNLHRLNGMQINGAATKVSGFGVNFKKDVRRFYGAVVGVSGRGESIPQRNNYCELDPEKVDQFGIPVLRFHYKWTDHEINQAKHMHQTFDRIIDLLGAVDLSTKRPSKENNYFLHKPGRIIHEVGTTRMGNDPQESVVNSNCQTHDVKNLFIVDGGPFVSQADKNPTWTILALAWRTSDFIIEQLNKRNI